MSLCSHCTGQNRFRADIDEMFHTSSFILSIFGSVFAFSKELFVAKQHVKK